MPAQTAHIEPNPDQLADELVTGDLGLISVHALLRGKVTWVAAAWDTRTTPIDAALDDTRNSLLKDHGVQIRRIRNVDAIEQLITDPGPTAAGVQHSSRGAIVLPGRRGMREPIRRLSQLAAAGPVVVICFDPASISIADALVLDPAPTASGLARAIDDAFALSQTQRRPAFVLVRDRLLGMRGTIRRHPTARSAEPVLVHERSQRGTSHRDMVIVGSAWSDHAVAMGVRAAAIDVDRLSFVVPTQQPRGAAADVLERARKILVIEDDKGIIAALLDERYGDAVVTRHACDAGSVGADQIASAIARWALTDATSAQAAIAPVIDDRGVLERMPRRNESLHRAVPQTVAAALALAQGVIGVPSRISDEYPTYRAETGVCLSVVPAHIFVEHGAASVAPDSGVGVILVPEVSHLDIATAAASMGASFEMVDATNPRAIGRAVAHACQSARTAPHVIGMADVVRIAPHGRAIGIDEDLLGADRIAMAGIAVESRTLAEVEDPLVPGPVARIVDAEALGAGVDPMAELTPSIHDVRVTHRAGTSRWSDMVWAIRSRIVRAITGVQV